MGTRLPGSVKKFLYIHQSSKTLDDPKHIKMIKLTQKLKDQLWWMIISVDYDYSRITVADHELNTDTLTLWLEAL
jgi:hypothetical protein